MKKNIRKLTAIILIASFFGTNICFAETYPLQYSNDIESQLEQLLGNPQCQTEETFDNATLKAGENFAVELIDGIDSQNDMPGDEVSAKLLFPIEVDNQVIIPEGSIVKGKIKTIKQSGGWYKNATMEVEFTQIECQDNYKLPIVASIKTKDNSGKLLGASGAERFGKVFSALSSVSLGSALAGFGIGLMGSYALAGAAVGFVLGGIIASGWLFFQKGKPVNIPSGTRIIITLKNDVAIDGFNI